MYYYEVWVRSNKYKGNSALTYHSRSRLAPGQIVSVPLRHETVTAVVIDRVDQPEIKTKAVEAISPLPPLPQSTLKLMRWLQAFYPAPVGVITQQFIPANLMHNKQTLAPIVKNLPPPTAPPPLTDEQAAALKQMTAYDTYLLHGRTGSGKTRLYQELAKAELKKGRSALILTPEISLTPQLENEFKSSFSDKVVVMHSSLTSKQRAERWAQVIARDAPLVLIGPRSIIFSPLKDIGLIVIDEAHEPAYKQEQAPYYVTSRVAAYLRDIQNAKLVLGSATPLVDDYFLALTRKKPIIKLTRLARETNQEQVKVKIIDAHDRSLFGRSSYLSSVLVAALEKTLSNGEQALLYLNRRGTARIIICGICDWQARCPRCDLALTYHGDTHILRCHVCGFISPAPTTCPKCNNPSVKYLSVGTKAIVSEVARLFPQANIARFDSDSPKAERLEQRYADIKSGKIDILIGTQLLAKGLDLPKLTLVGVVLADTSLQLPDYSVNERTYQLLTQVIGRVGRGHLAGEAIVQTYNPKARSITCAVTNDWDTFYKAEIAERKAFNYPPFTHLLKLTLARANPKNAERAATLLKTSLPKTVHIDGPAPSFHEKQANKYRWQLVIKSERRSTLVDIINHLPSGVSWDIDPYNLM